jgi:hypothetical protein
LNSDIRLYVSFKGHRKRLKLRRVLGESATDYLIDLWLTVAQDRPDGVLTGWDESDIALAAGWEGEPQELVKALIDCRLLDEGECYSLHDWAEHQPWACNAQQRSDRARRSAMARWSKLPHAERMPDACGTHTERNAPLLSSPILSKEEEKSREEKDATLDDMNPLEDEVANLQNWGAFGMDDRAWLESATKDYPSVLPADVRDMGTWWYAKAEKDRKVTHSKAQWKTRLRNWLRHKVEGRKDGQVRGPARSLPGNGPSGAFSGITS